MYLYQPCLLTLSLYAWAFDPLDHSHRWLHVLFPLIVLAVSEIELTFISCNIYPASLLLVICFLIREPCEVEWAEVLTASLLGGLMCWKVVDRWPLFSGILPLCAGVLLIPVVLLCRSRKGRLLSCSLGGLVFELFFCLKEHILFSFCVVRFGSRDGLSLVVASMCLYFLFEQVCLAAHIKKNNAIYASK